MFYYNGLGVIKDYKKAAKLWSEAAIKGDREAQKGLGILYAYGFGVSQDYVEAYAWFNIAASQGHEEAKSIRDKIEEKIFTNQQISDGQKRTRELIEEIQAQQAIGG